MKEVKPSHKNLYIIMKWKMAKLLIKFTDSLDLSTQRNLGFAISQLKQAKTYLKESKEAGGEQHPKIYEIDDLELKIWQKFQSLDAHFSMVTAKQFIEESRQAGDMHQRTSKIMDAI